MPVPRCNGTVGLNLVGVWARTVDHSALDSRADLRRRLGESLAKWTAMLDRRPEQRVSVPAGTVMYLPRPSARDPPEFVAKAARYGWPADTDLTPAWIVSGHCCLVQVSRSVLHQLTLATTAVLTRDVQQNAVSSTIGEPTLPGDRMGGFTIKPGA